MALLTVIKSQRHKSESRPPNPHNLAHIFSSTHPEEASKAHQPIRADPTQEDLVKVGRDLFRAYESVHLVSVARCIENAAIACNDCDNKERAGEVAEECHDPMEEHFRNRQTSMQDCDGGELSILAYLAGCVVRGRNTRKEPVHKSLPVSTTMHNPYGKTSAAIVRIRPGASDWYHGEAFVLRSVAHAKASSMPAMTEDMKILSRRVLAFATPARETISVVSAGV